MTALTERQRKFAEYYNQCGNGADAARNAGYSESYAAHRTDKLLRNVEIAAYIKQLSKTAKTARIMTARDRQELLSDIARDENKSAADRIRAVDTLNKMTGEYMQKQKNDNGEKELPKLLEALEDTDDI